MAVIVDPCGLDPHRRRDERGEEERRGSRRASRHDEIRGFVGPRTPDAGPGLPGRSPGAKLSTISATRQASLDDLKLTRQCYHPTLMRRPAPNRHPAPPSDRRDALARACPFGNRLVTSQAVREQHANTADLDRRTAAGRGGLPADHAGGGGDRDAVRRASRAGDPVRRPAPRSKGTSTRRSAASASTSAR